jgi:hypothetical protein
MKSNCFFIRLYPFALLSRIFIRRVMRSRFHLCVCVPLIIMEVYEIVLISLCPWVSCYLTLHDHRLKPQTSNPTKLEVSVNSS